PSAASMAAIAAKLSVAALAPPPAPVAAPKTLAPVLKAVGGLAVVVGALIGGARLWPTPPPRASTEGAAAPPTVPPKVPDNAALPASRREAVGPGAAPLSRPAIEAPPPPTEPEAAPAPAPQLDNAASQPAIQGAREPAAAAEPRHQ